MTESSAIDARQLVACCAHPQHDFDPRRML
jgi:hypothetical protein